MFIIDNLIKFNDFIVDIDNIIKSLDYSCNLYYVNWTIDVKNFNNSAPEVNINYSGYFYQKRRVRLLRKFKNIFLKHIDRVSENDFLTKEEMNFLVLQPEIKNLFDYYQIIIL